MHLKIELVPFDNTPINSVEILKNFGQNIDIVAGLRTDLLANEVDIVDFDMFSLNAFNKAAQENVPIITVEGWEDVHPLLKIVQAEWDCRIPFGILYSLVSFNNKKAPTNYFVSVLYFLRVASPPRT